jgi:predicted acetyltransferase
MTPRLESPSASLRESYLSLVDEFRRRGEPLVPFPLGFPADDFPAFLEKLKACSEGRGIPEGFVAHETFWLVAGGGGVVGVSSLRLALSESLRRHGGHIGYGVRPSARRRGYATLILAETLGKARDRGISRVLLTCDRSNIGSRRAILNNGGAFDSEELLPGHAEPTQRFWVSVT